MTVFAIVSVRDIVAETFGRPFMASNIPSAIRSLTHEINSPEAGTLHSNPGDFELYNLGEFDDESGAITVFDSPRFVCRGYDLVNAVPGRAD